MSKITGRDGVIRFNNKAVLQTRTWSIDETGDAAESSVTGNGSRFFLPTINSWQGSADVYYDIADEGIFDNALIGAQAYFELYPDGFDVPAIVYEGNCIITGNTKNASFDGMVESTITFQGSGVLARNEII